MPDAELAHRVTLTRARRELGALAGEEREWGASNAVRLVHAFDMRAGRYLVRAQVVTPVPDATVQLAATVVRTIGEALDGLATSLAGAPAKFPIFESLAMFAQRARKGMARMSDEAQATIEDLQPYHEIGGFEGAPLWRLKALNAVEAPRLTGSVRDGGTMGVNTARGVDVASEPQITSGVFTDGAIIASVPARVVGPDPKLDMYLRVDFALAYLERGPGRGRDVVELLGDLCDHVEQQVFPALEAEASR